MTLTEEAVVAAAVVVGKEIDDDKVASIVNAAQPGSNRLQIRNTLFCGIKKIERERERETSFFFIMTRIVNVHTWEGSVEKTLWNSFLTYVCHTVTIKRIVEAQESYFLNVFC